MIINSTFLIVGTMGVPRVGFGYIPTNYLLLWLKLRKSPFRHLEYNIQPVKIVRRALYQHASSAASKNIAARTSIGGRLVPRTSRFYSNSTESCRATESNLGQIRRVLLLRVFLGLFEYNIQFL